MVRWAGTIGIHGGSVYLATELAYFCFFFSHEDYQSSKRSHHLKKPPALDIFFSGYNGFDGQL